MDKQVLVVGGGPVGLTLAVDLGRRGVRCILIEQKQAPQFLPKMERCNARTMEIFRRMGIADKVRAAGLRGDIPMDVFIILSLAERPLLHLPYPSVERARAEIRACSDGSMPLEPYQLISQYTLEPLLKSIAEGLPSVTVRYGCQLESFTQDESGVTAHVKHANGTGGVIGASYMVGCDGGGSTVRKQLGIKLRGEHNLLELRQALYRCDELFERIPIGKGPGRGRHYHVADGNNGFLIMQDSTKHFTLHAVVEKDADMNAMFERTVAIPVKYEMLTCAPWRQNLLLADRYRDGRVFLADAGVHAETPGRYHKVHGVAGEEHAAIPITVRQQQVLPPGGAGEHLVLHWNCDGALEHRIHVGVLLDHGMQGEVLGRVLHDEKAVVAVGNVIVAPPAWALADGDALEQLIAAIQRLAQLEQVVLAAQLDAELLAHGARAAVAAHHIRRADRAARAVRVLHARGDPGLVLGKRLEPATVAYLHRGQPLGDRFQQRLQRVLRDELVRFQRHAPVAAGADLGARPLHRRVGKMQERRLNQREDDEHVHRDVLAQAGGADLVRDSHAPEDFHGARIASLHLRQELRRFLLLDQRAAHAAPAEIDGERKADRTAADDEYLLVHRPYSALPATRGRRWPRWSSQT